MKNITLFFAAAIIWTLASCGSKTPAVPVSDLVKKVWTANIVKHDATVVFTKGAASNQFAGYSNFKLNLASPPTVTMTDFDGNTFSGQYSLPTDTQLVLTNLNPAPTGTGGTITFTISSTPTDTQLNLARTTASQKTGGTTNTYQLVNP